MFESSQDSHACVVQLADTTDSKSVLIESSILSTGTILSDGAMVAQQPPKLFGESSSLSRGAFIFKKTVYKYSFLC